MYVSRSREAPVVGSFMTVSIEVAESLLSWSAAAERRCLVSKRDGVKASALTLSLS